MDLDDGVPPPIRRVSREALEIQKAIQGFGLEDSESDRDDATPPPIRRLRTSSSGASPSASSTKPSAASPKRPGYSPGQPTVPSPLATPPRRTITLQSPYYTPSSPLPNRTPAPLPGRIPGSYPSTSTSPTPSPKRHPPPLPNKSPLRSRPEPEPLKQSRPNHTRNFSHPFKGQSQPPSQPRYANTASYRNPPRPLSFRNSPRMPYGLRRWGSLETIDSVQTTDSALEETSRKSSFDGAESTTSTNTTTSKRQYLTFYDDAESVVENGPSSSTQPRTPSDHSRPQSSASSSLQLRSTATQGNGSRRSPATSIIRKLNLNTDKQPEPLLTPGSLEMQERASLDQRSRTNSSNSSMTISSGRPSELVFPSLTPTWSTSQSTSSQVSVSSKDWQSSNFDISGLSEAELKKCRKKNINPALYAEMKAARKGRFVSPIGGNTFI